MVGFEEGSRGGNGGHGSAIKSLLSSAWQGCLLVCLLLGTCLPPRRPHPCSPALLCPSAPSPTQITAHNSSILLLGRAIIGFGEGFGMFV